MPTIYALSGRHNSGKTTTLNLLLTSLESKYPSRTEVFRRGRKDLTVVMDLPSGQRVGVACGGDTAFVVNSNLTTLTSHNCDVIFCATRSYGGTVDAVNTYAASHSIHFEVKQVNANDDLVVARKLLTLTGL
ncbi:hypothetical protein [Vibrio alginolyticus]|uniref:hypothetical protein n=1 Tax=Vibrio alginolyticus TaxID=663 RepID=UPI00375475A9